MNIVLACCYGCVALEAGELDRVECIMVISRALSEHPEIVTYNFLDVEINVTSTVVLSSIGKAIFLSLKFVI